MEIVFIRHTSVDVPSGVCYGQTDVPLKPTFEQEAAVTKENLKAYLPFNHVYTSPLTRCVRLATYCGYPDAEHDKRIMEINFGDWEMKPFDRNDDPRLQEWYADYLNVAATGGESFAMQYQRVSRFLDELKTKPYQQSRRSIQRTDTLRGHHQNCPIRDKQVAVTMATIIIIHSAQRLMRTATCISSVVKGRSFSPI